MDRHLQDGRAQAELVGRQAGQRRAHRRADGERTPWHQRLAVEAEHQRRQAADADAAQPGERDDVADAEARHRLAERRQQEAHRPQASRVGLERAARAGGTIARLQAAMEKHAGGDDGDDVPAEPRAGRRLAQEQGTEHGAAAALQDDDEGGRQRRRQAGKTGHQGADAARGEQAEHEQQRQESEEGGHLRARCWCAAHSDVRQSAGRPSQAQRPLFDTVACGSGSGVSLKQPPAIPVRDGHPSAFQSRVVPQAAQNQRRCALTPLIS
jgi:hypothetical protein